MKVLAHEREPLRVGALAVPEETGLPPIGSRWLYTGTPQRVCEVRGGGLADEDGSAWVRVKAQGLRMHSEVSLRFFRANMTLLPIEGSCVGDEESEST